VPDVRLDVPDQPDYWTSLYLDSKLSCLDLAAQIPGMRVAPGVTVDSWDELRGALDALLTGDANVIVRGMHGVSGVGSAVIRPGRESLEEFWRSVRDDPLLRIFPLSVQRFLPHRAGLGCPAVDMLIDDGPADNIAELTMSVMTIDSHRFVCVDIGTGLMPGGLEDEIRALSSRIARAVRRLGFRGWFGVDFLVDAHETLYVTEFNARRTGGTQWIPLLDRWAERGVSVVHARHEVLLPRTLQAGVPVGWTGLSPVIDRLRDDGAPVLTTAIRALDHPRRRSFGVVTGGAGAPEATEYADRLDEYLATMPAGTPVNAAG
jgi:hypothetical protein